MLTGIISYGFATLAFLTLSILLMVSKQTGKASKVLIIASLMSLLWAVGSVFLTIKPNYLWAGTAFLDPLRIFSWALLVLTLLTGKHISSTSNVQNSQHWLTNKVLLSIAGLTVLCQLLFLIFPAFGSGSSSSQLFILALGWMIAPILALYLVEQLYFNTQANRQASIRYLCVGLAAMFIFDFVLYADTLLFKQIRIDIWQARGILYSILVPVVAITVARNPSWAVELHVSRQAVTTSATFLGAGIYLLATAFAASLIQLGQFEGVSLILVTTVVLSLVALTLVLLSKKFRAKLRVSISKHFFNFKYDYRVEWLKFTRTLACDIDAAPDAIVQGFIDIVDSNAGILWGKDKNGGYTQLASSVEILDTGIAQTELNSLELYLDKSGWLVDIEEYRVSPENYDKLKLPDSIVNNAQAWLIIPLPFQEKIEGYVLVYRSAVTKNINWEDRDLLKTAGHQAAGLLAQRRAHQKLKQASQFEAFSKLSAYIVHDLKNILGQQSLIVSNAPKHKHNPEFIDDVIITVDNSVDRMRSLLKQLREPGAEDKSTAVDLIDLLKQVVISLSKNKPAPVLECDTNTKVVLMTSEEKLLRVFSHLIQNAQEATHSDGMVRVTVHSDEYNATVLVEDTGTGMTQAFIRDKLFTAFETTKGLTGMGIGVFESREYIRSLGGEIGVDSTAGKGTCFRIQLPLAPSAPATQ